MRTPFLVGLDDEEIRRRVRRALRNVPHARGVNNHMGSKATANERVMRLVLSELKDRNLLFLDSPHHGLVRRLSTSGRYGYQSH